MTYWPQMRFCRVSKRWVQIAFKNGRILATDTLGVINLFSHPDTPKIIRENVLFA